MPRRNIVFANGEYYHIYNRGVNKSQIFFNKRDYARFLITSKYYSYLNTPIRYSRLLIQNSDIRDNIWRSLQNEQKQIEILCYCLMPNHYHFLLKQNTENGISNFIKRLQTSFSLYKNTKYKNDGHLWTGQFKAVLVEDDNQLIHLSRYIHLNPFTSFLVKNIEDIQSYNWSSYPEYLGYSTFPICNTKIVMDLFKSKNKYQRFVSNQGDYQRKLKYLKDKLFD